MEVETEVTLATTSDLRYIILGYTGSFGAGGSDFYPIKTDTAGNVGVEETIWQSLPESFYLGQNYPNPFNSVTTIPYKLNITHGWRVKVFHSPG